MQITALVLDIITSNSDPNTAPKIVNLFDVVLVLAVAKVGVNNFVDGMDIGSVVID